MTTRNLLLLFFFSLVATTVLWIFNIQIFATCYNPALKALVVVDLPFNFSLENTRDCLLITAPFIFSFLFLVPLIVGLLSALGYQLYMGKRLSYVGYIVWFSWLAVLYYVAFKLTIFRIPT
jgi:hypothetical protein